jgi:UDP-glucose 4-epimerase
MRVLVTGGMGFIGSRLVSELNRRGFEVDIADLKNGIDIRLGLSGVYDIIFHLAALRIVPKSFELDREYFDTNVYGTYKILSCFPETRVVNISTSSASNPIAPYGLSKLLGEKVAERHNNVVSLRLFSPFGEGELCPDLVISVFAQSMLVDNPVYIHSNGLQDRDFTYVEDVVNEIIWHGLNDSKGVYQVGYGKSVSINDLFKRMADFFGYKKDPIYLPKRMGDQVHTKSLDLLHINPIGFDEGLNRTMEWWKGEK